MRSLGVFHVCKRIFVLLVGLGLWATGAPVLRAQQPLAIPPKQPQVARCYVKKTKFNLPLNMNQQTRNCLSKIQLFCRNNANGKWVMLAECPPTQTGFNFDAHGEGEFWFTLGMVDMLKRVVPADPSQSEYKMAVVVDLTPPIVDAQFVNSTSEGYIVQADARDVNLDPRKTTFEYQTLNLDWRALEPMAPGSNRYCIPVQAAISGLVRVCAADLAENTVAREIDLSLLKKASRQIQAAFETNSASRYIPLTEKMAYSPGQPPAPQQITTEAPVPVASSKKDSFVSPMPPVQVEDVSQKVQVVHGTVIHAKEKAPAFLNTVQPARAADVVPTGPAIEHSEDNIQQRINPTPDFVPEASPTVNKIGAVVPASASSQPAASGPMRKLINQRQLKLDYRLEHVGASGVGKVEIWITSDQGQSWQKLGEDVERKSPVMIELPGEGLYGITIVVSNGRGFGGTPPNPGDAPDTWVEVDMTRPGVEIKEIRAGSADDPGTVHVTWNVQDRNLAPEPVDLYFATSREGNWSLIARGLRNDGHYRWVPPSSVGPQVFIRLVARDLAGNATVVETSQPFAVDDMSRPRVRLINIAPVSPDIRLEP